MTAAARKEGKTVSGMKIVAAYDGSPDARAALAYGINKARAAGGELIVFRVLRRNIFCDEDGKPCTTEEILQDTLNRHERKDTLVHRSDSTVRTTVVFAAINTPHDILRYAGKVGADLIGAPPEFEPVMAKACCLVDIVIDRRGDFGSGIRPGPRSLMHSL